MKKAVSILLALLMMISVSSFAANAADPTQITDEAGLLAALGGAGGDYILMANITMTEKATVTADVNLNFNGFKVTSNTTVSPRYAVTVTDGGDLLLTGSGSWTEGTYAPFRVNKAGSGASPVLTIDGPSIVGDEYGVFIRGNGTAGSSVLVVESGSITATHVEGCAISGNGSTGYGGTDITINGGSITGGAEGAGVYHPQLGTLTVNGGSITGGDGIMVKSGSIVVNGGTITGTADYAVPSFYNNGTEISGAAIGATSNSAYSGEISITINNGTLISEEGYGVDHYSTNFTADTDVSNIIAVEIGADATVAAPQADPVNLTVEIAGETLQLADEDPGSVVISDQATLLSYSTGGSTDVIASASPSYVIVIPPLVDFGTVNRAMAIQTKDFSVAIEDAIFDQNASVTVGVTSDFSMKEAASAAVLDYVLNNGAADLATGDLYCTFAMKAVALAGETLIDADTFGASVVGSVSTDPSQLTRAGSYSDVMTFVCEYVAA